MKKILTTIAAWILLFSPLLTSAAYLDWSANSYTDAEVIETLYGNNSSYNTQRTTQCNTWTMTVVAVSPGAGFDGLGRLDTPNTIYVLENGDYPLTSAKMIMGSCIAVVGKWGTNIYSTVQQSDTMIIYGAATNVIIDNLDIDGIHGTPDHSKNNIWINLQAIRGTVTNNTINNNTISNMIYAFNIAGNMDASNNFFTNNTITDSDYGIYVNEVNPGTTSWLTISWNELVNNGTGIEDNGTDPVIDDNLFSGNTTVGNTGTNPSGTDVTTAITEPTTCTDPNGCTCYGIVIANGTQCTDGNRTTVTNGASCTDPNGCVCGGNNINNWATCTIASSWGGGWGGGSSTPRDNCPDGDYTNSYYDGSCGAPNNSGGLALGGIITNDTYNAYGAIAKAHLLANDYETLVAQGETELRHGLFFSIIATYAEMKNRSNSKVAIIIGALANVFAQMNEELLAKYGFDKTIFLAELARLKE